MPKKLYVDSIMRLFLNAKKIQVNMLESAGNDGGSNKALENPNAKQNI